MRKKFTLDAAQKALATQHRQICLNSAKAWRGPSVEAMHDLRVAALRAGFALKFFRKFFSAGHIRLLRRGLACARQVMAKRRDGDVSFCRIKKDLGLLRLSSAQRRKILKIIQAQKAKARQEVVEMLGSPRYKKMLKDLRRIIATRNKRIIKPQGMLKEILRKLDHRQGPLRPAQLHKMRIRFKRLRYACEFLTDFYEKQKIQKVIKDIIAVQDVLGERQDAEITVRTLNRLKSMASPDQMRKLIDIEKGHALNAYKKFKDLYDPSGWRKHSDFFRCS